MEGWTKLVVLILLSNVVVDAASLSSLLTPKNLDRLIGMASPFFIQPDEPRAAANLNSIRETITKSAKENEGWSSLSKRLATLAVTGNEEKALENSMSNSQLANSLIEGGPQVIKDIVDVQQHGFIKPFLERLTNVMALRNKKPTAEEKQAGIDAFVFGVNGLLNFVYGSTMLGANLPRMGLENLFNPDYDYDYEDEEEEIEEELGSQEAAFNPISSLIPSGLGQKNNQEQFSSDYQTHFQNNVGSQDYSSYSHYAGQKMPLSSSPNHIVVNHPIHHNWNNQPRYNKFKIYNPNKKS